MNKLGTILASSVLLLGLVGCGAGESTAPETTSTTSAVTTSPTTSSTSTTTSSTSAESPMSSESTPQTVVEETNAEPSSVAQEPVVAPEAPPFMQPEEYDPYGPPQFVRCWEANAAVMSDGTIVGDAINCAPEVPQEASYMDGYPPQAPRADGCVSPAATCGYYDESGNPIWFDKQTGETSPRYYDEFGNPTMEAP
ncbi:hypothetical protein ACXZ66_03455 [Corynebacterium sp. S7]